MQINISNLMVDVPDGWNDSSTLVFTKPSALADARAVGKQSSRPDASLTVNWHDAPPKGDVDAWLREHFTRVSAAAPNTRLLDQGRLSAPDRVAAFVTYQIEVPAPLVQMMIAQVIGTRVVLVTGTTVPGLAERLRPTFEQVATSIVSQPL